MAGDVGLLCHGKDATGSGDAVVTDDHGTVVQRAVLEENVLNQRTGDVGVDHNPSRYDVVQVVFSREQDECALLDFRHVDTGFGDGVDVEINIAPHPQKLEFSGQFAFLGLGAYGEQETSYLRLEYDDECDEAHANKGSKDGGEHFHLQGLDQLPDEEDGHNANEDAHGRGAFQQTV